MDCSNKMFSLHFYYGKRKAKDGTSTCMHARYNCDLDDFEWFKRCIEEQSFRNKVAQFLKENINDFIQYVD